MPRTFLVFFFGGRRRRGCTVICFLHNCRSFLCISRSVELYWNSVHQILSKFVCTFRDDVDRQMNAWMCVVSHTCVPFAPFIQ